MHCNPALYHDMLYNDAYEQKRIGRNMFDIKFDNEIKEYDEWIHSDKKEIRR